MWLKLSVINKTIQSLVEIWNLVLSLGIIDKIIPKCTPKRCLFVNNAEKTGNNNRGKKRVSWQLWLNVSICFLSNFQWKIAKCRLEIIFYYWVWLCSIIDWTNLAPWRLVKTALSCQSGGWGLETTTHAFLPPGYEWVRSRSVGINCTSVFLASLFEVSPMNEIWFIVLKRLK